MKNPKVQGRYRGVQPSKRDKVKKSARVKDRREKALRHFFEEYWHREKSILKQIQMQCFKPNESSRNHMGISR
jgi:hypothetical protein